MNQQPLFVIDERAIMGLVNDPRHRQSFPFLENARLQLTAPTSKSCCRKTAQIQRAQIMQQIRRQIVSMPGQQKLAMKKIFNAQRLRITASGNRGKPVVYTF